MSNEPEIRDADPSDVQNLASLRGGGERLEQTMLGYLQGTYFPSCALADRAVFVGTVDNVFAGYIAGHRTTRHGCDGELQWLNVAECYRGMGVASALIERMFDWFIDHSILNVCVNVASENVVARTVYFRHGAQHLDPYWLVWPDLSAR